MSEFDNINGIYAKDVTLRDGIATLRNTVTSQTIKPLTVTQNGTYTADPSEGTYGYSPVTVDVQEKPWAPLQDGYSNFWFELTNDTLSPWLNFSAKNNDAVIDWGDGSGEVALDTLTPTHTYSKAGKYVVKVKGVTGVTKQYTEGEHTEYMPVLKAVELNNEVTILNANAFRNGTGLEHFTSENNSLDVGTAAFRYCIRLAELNLNADTTGSSIFAYCFGATKVTISNTVTSMPSSIFAYCGSLNKITIPASVTSIAGYALRNCINLTEIHILSTTPATLGTNPFQDTYANYVIYVPVGYGDTYKSAAGWSTYADHILEEGQTPNRAMLSRLAKAADTDTDEEMR